MSIKLDGREVQVGDRLWSFCYGWGVVSVCTASYLLLRTQCGGHSFDIDGKWATAHNRTLFWNEIKFEIPPPPKKKIKKWQWIFKYNDGTYGLTFGYYATREEVEKQVRPVSVEGKLECSVIEVDEE